MSGRFARCIGVLVVIATLGALSACAGSSERLPECKGRAVPINRSGEAGVPGASASINSPGTVAAQDPAGGARDAE